jgi:uroporphyrinogen-III synthase
LLTRGIKADKIAPVAIAEGILECYSENELHNKKILLPHSSLARPILEESLTEKGAHVTEIKLYTPMPPKHSFFPIKEGDIVFFTSASTATHFFTHPEYKNQKIEAICIGPITADEVRKYTQTPVKIAEKPTLEALINLVSVENP